MKCLNASKPGKLSAALAGFDCGGVRLFLNVGDPAKNSLIYFQVPHIHAECDHLKSRGVEFISAPHMIHKHTDGTEEWMAFFNDPDGQPLGLMMQVAEPGGA